jgi:hypothetical protein
MELPGYPAFSSAENMRTISPEKPRQGSPTYVAVDSSQCPTPDAPESSKTPLTRPGHLYTNNTTSGNARAHFGDVYNYHNSDAAQQALLTWLSPLDPSDSHNQACKQYLDNTLRWFFEDQRFQTWCNVHEDTSPQILWCQGDPGTGKTTLIAQILCRLQAMGISSGDMSIVYCRYAERSVQSIENVTGSILAQLFQTSEQGFDISSRIEHASKNQPWFWRRRPTFADLKTWLDDRLEASRPVFALVDALDELDARTRQDLCAYLLSTLGSGVRLLFTSRDVPEIGMASSSTQIVKISAHGDDLRAVVDAELLREGNEVFQRSISSKPSRDPGLTTLQEEISSTVVATAREMYAAP